MAPAMAAPAAAATPAVVTLGFDDQRVSQATAGPLLAAQGFHGTFYVISQFIDAAGSHPESLNMAQLKSLEVAGNEIGGHTKTHPDLVRLTAAQRNAEICGGRTDLVNDGFKAPVSFAYPYGSFNASVETVVKSCGFNNARTVADGPESIPPAVPMATAAMPSVQAVANATDPAVTVANMKSWVTGAETGNNKWVQVVWHDIVTQGSQAEDEYYQLTPDFTAFLTWLKTEVTAGRVVVKTAGEAIGGGTPTQTVPGAPVIGTPKPGVASATVNWTAPADNGGSAITGYTVNAYDGAGTTVFKSQNAAAGATSLVVTGLTNGTAYTFTVAATNAAGTGALSARSVAVTPGTVPGAPVIGTAVAGTAGGPIEATAKWAPPAATGGSAITGYRVTALRMSGGTVLASTVSTTDQPATSRSLNMTLPVAGNYRFTVQAINAVGAGAASARSNRVAGFYEHRQ